MRIGDSADPLEEPLGGFLRAFADDQGHPPAPGWRQGHPPPGIALTFAQPLRRPEGGLLGRDETPQCIPWAFRCGAMLPGR